MIKTAFPKIYDEMVEVNKLFLRKHHLFVFGLVYGLLYDYRSSASLNSDIARINSIREQTTTDIVDFIFLLLNNKNEREEKIFEEMLRIADGGVEKLKERYDKYNDFKIQDLIIESEKIWPEKISIFIDKKISLEN